MGDARLENRAPTALSRMLTGGPAMKLYDWHFAPNPRRVKMFLAEKNVQVPIEEVGEPGTFALKRSFMERFNPYALAPTLELDDGTCLSEGMAICRYFEDLHPQPSLMGRDALGKATIEMWERRAFDGAMLAIGELLRNTNPGFLDRGLPGTTETITQVPELVERGKGRLSRFSRSADKQLAKNEFLAGPAFSVADITAYCALEFLNRAVQMSIPAELGNLTRWYGAIADRKSAKSTQP
jgi:glutathione S-transferase